MITTANITLTKTAGIVVITPASQPQFVTIRNTSTTANAGIGGPAMTAETDGFVLLPNTQIQLTVLPGDVLYGYGDNVVIAVMQQKQA